MGGHEDMSTNKLGAWGGCCHVAREVHKWLGRCLASVAGLRMGAQECLCGWKGVV